MNNDPQAHAETILRVIAISDTHGMAGNLARGYFRYVRHASDLELSEPSPIGKTQWRCRVCGRITQAAERECYTIDMQADRDLT